MRKNPSSRRVKSKSLPMICYLIIFGLFLAIHLFYFINDQFFAYAGAYETLSIIVKKSLIHSKMYSRTSWLIFQWPTIILAKNNDLESAVNAYSFIHSFLPVLSLALSCYLLKKLKALSLLPIVLLNYICVVSTSSIFLTSPHRLISIFIFPMVLFYMTRRTSSARFFTLLLGIPFIVFCNVTSVLFVAFLVLVFSYRKFYLNIRTHRNDIFALVYSGLLACLALYLSIMFYVSDNSLTRKMSNILGKIDHSLDSIGIIYISFIFIFIFSIFRKKLAWLLPIVAALLIMTCYPDISRHYHHSYFFKILSTPLSLLLVTSLIFFYHRGTRINQSYLLLPLLFLFTIVFGINTSNSFAFKRSYGEIINHPLNGNEGCHVIKRGNLITNYPLVAFDIIPSISLVLQLKEKSSIQKITFLETYIDDESEQISFRGFNPCLNFNAEDATFYLLYDLDSGPYFRHYIIIAELLQQYPEVFKTPIIELKKINDCQSAPLLLVSEEPIQLNIPFAGEYKLLLQNHTSSNRSTASSIPIKIFQKDNILYEGDIPTSDTWVTVKIFDVSEPLSIKQIQKNHASRLLVKCIN